jgi:hypothetical protein
MEEEGGREGGQRIPYHSLAEQKYEGAHHQLIPMLKGIEYRI